MTDQPDLLLRPVLDRPTVLTARFLNTIRRTTFSVLVETVRNAESLHLISPKWWIFFIASTSQSSKEEIIIMSITDIT